MPPRATPHRQLELFVAGLFCFLTVTQMAQSGMFVDGVTYAAISRNLAQGIGTFWAPSYTATLYPQFFDHPPLGFGLQAVAFAIFGDHLLVERAYSLAMGGVTAMLIVAIWRNTVGTPERAWLPVLFWLLPEAVTWSIAGNMLENAQMVFTTLAVFSFVRSLRTGTRTLLWGSLGGVSIVAAVLTKGPVGLFPLAAPLVLAVVMRHRALDALRVGSVMFVCFVIGSVVILMEATARNGLWMYWQQQIVPSLAGARERAPGRWVLGLELFGGIGLRMGGAIVLALVWFRTRLRTHGLGRGRHAWTWFFLGTALAGSVPIAISPKIMGVYLVPSIPFYALASASLTHSLLARVPDSRAQERTGLPVAGALGVALLVASVAMPLAWGPLEPRDVEWVAEYRSLSPLMPREATIGTCAAASTDWRLHAYMQRLFQVSLDADQTIERGYFLQLAEARCEAPIRCRPLATSRRLSLLQCDE